jgi:single-stranded DNA-binding protein
MSGIEAAFFGVLGRDGESKISKNGKAYLRLNVRVGDGGAQWISVLAFDERAIEQAGKFTKGARIYCEGPLTLNEWAGQDGVVRHGLSCMSFHCRLAGIGQNKQKRNADAAAPPPAPQSDNEMNDEIPF